MSKGIVIVGAGDHGKSVADLLLWQDEYEPVGFVDNSYPEASDVWGFPLFGKVTAEALLSLQGSIEYVVIAIGNNSLRESIFKLIDGLGLCLPSIVHPHAFVSPRAMLGSCCVVMVHAVIGGTEARLGDSVIVSSGAIADYHTVVDDFAHLGRKLAWHWGTVCQYLRCKP